MNLHEAPGLAATAAVASIVAAVSATSPAPGLTARTQAARAIPIDCHLEVQPGRETVLRLTNLGTGPLARGTRFAWVTLGTPMPHGELRELPRRLAEGDSVWLAANRTAHAAGCTAAIVG